MRSQGMSIRTIVMIIIILIVLAAVVILFMSMMHGQLWSQTNTSVGIAQNLTNNMTGS